MAGRWIRMTAVCLLLVMLSAAAGCSSVKNYVTSRIEGRESDEESSQGYNIYYVAKDESRIGAFPYKLSSTNERAIIDECIMALSQAPKGNDFRAVLGGDVSLTKVDYPDESKTLRLYFTEDYHKMGAVTEILERAAIVKTLTQFSGIVNYVSFCVGQEWISGSDGQPLKMSSRDFISVLNLSRDQIAEADFTLYFVAPDGKGLKRCSMDMRYDQSTRPEQVVLGALIRGPSSGESLASISKNTQIKSTYVRDGICTVDFNQGFLEKVGKQNFRLNLYSVVNSLIELEDVDKVVITVDGKAVEKGPDGVAMAGELTADETLVTAQEESAALEDTVSSEGEK